MNSTKAAIIEMFWQLLDKKPYSKITVKDIVTGCQINRNTFYYYFQDIPDLLQQTTEDYAIRLSKITAGSVLWQTALCRL